MTKPKIIVFATGGQWPEEWWSWFKELTLKQIIGSLKVDIVAAISSHKNGWVAKKAGSAWIKLIHMEKPFTAEKYQKIVEDTNADLVALSGRIHLVQWIDPTKCINIHPWPLGKYGGKWMYGDAVHTAIYEDLKKWDINRTCVTMHFVTLIYDDPQGLIFQLPIELRSDEEIMKHIDNKEACIAAIKKKVNKAEHTYQRWITNMVANGEISATRDEESQKITNIIFPVNYTYKQPVQLNTERPYGEF